MKTLIVALLLIIFTGCTGKQVSRICQDASAKVVSTCKSITLSSATAVNLQEKVQAAGSKKASDISPIEIYSTIRRW
jgi:acyl-coenzyme A synthetase/AMP-(fatty) acid ligase